MSEPSNVEAPVTEFESIRLQCAAISARIGIAYAPEQATKPSRISFALASTPIALLSWYVCNGESCKVGYEIDSSLGFLRLARSFSAEPTKIFSGSHSRVGDTLLVH